MGSHDRTHRFLLWRKVQTSRCAPSQSSRCRVALKYPHHRCAKLIESMLANEAGASRRVSVARFPLGDCGFHLLLDCLEVAAPFCIGGKSIAVCASSPTFCCT